MLALTASGQLSDRQVRSSAEPSREWGGLNVSMTLACWSCSKGTADVYEYYLSSTLTECAFLFAKQDFGACLFFRYRRKYDVDKYNRDELVFVVQDTQR